MKRMKKNHKMRVRNERNIQIEENPKSARDTNVTIQWKPRILKVCEVLTR